MNAVSRRIRDALIALAVLAASVSVAHAQGAPAPGAAASTTMLQGSAVIEERKAELTKQLTDEENERHDNDVAANATQVDSENLRHQEALQGIEQQNTPAKQVEVNNENRNHENNLKLLKDRLDEENQRHADNLSQIPARIAQMLGSMFHSAGGGGIPGGGAPGAGNYPAQTGAPNTTTENVPAQPGNATPAKPGTPQNPLTGYVSGLRPPASGSGAQPSSPGSPSNAGTASGPAAPGGHSPLYYLNNALNDAVSRVPNGTQALQQAGQNASQVDQIINRSLNDTARKMQAVRDSMADQMVKKWTQPMSPQTALTEVVAAWATGAAGAGIGAAARTGVQGGTFGTALKAAASATAQEAKVTAGLGRAANASAGALTSRATVNEGGEGGPPTGTNGSSASGPPNESGNSPSNAGGANGGTPPGGRQPPGNNAGGEPEGGAPGWRPPTPTITRDGNIVKATWPGTPATVEFEPHLGGVRINVIDRRGLPRGSGGVVLATALRAGGIETPKFFQLIDIIEKDTLAQAAQGTPAIDTTLGRTAANAARDLGGRILGQGEFHPAQAGVMGQTTKPWMEFQIAYPR